MRSQHDNGIFYTRPRNHHPSEWFFKLHPLIDHLAEKFKQLFALSTLWQFFSGDKYFSNSVLISSFADFFFFCIAQGLTKSWWSLNQLCSLIQLSVLKSILKRNCHWIQTQPTRVPCFNNPYPYRPLLPNLDIGSPFLESRGELGATILKNWAPPSWKLERTQNSNVA